MKIKILMLALLVCGFLFNGTTFGQNTRLIPKKEKRPMIERVHETSNSTNNSKKKVSGKKTKAHSKLKASAKKAKAKKKLKIQLKKMKSSKKTVSKIDNDL